MWKIVKLTKNYDIWIVSLIFTSILTLSHIRMYGHDTNGWMLPARVWFVDMLRQGDIPFWFGLVKYGFPTTIAQFVGTFWSPYAILLALFGNYTARTLATEFFLWRLTALLGTYWLARAHFGLKRDAIIVSAIFIGTGTFSSQDVQLEIYAGMAVVPWIIGAIDRCVSGYSARTRLLGSGVLGISGAVILWSGYPGIWIPFPFLIAPYILLRMLFSRRENSLTLSFVFLFFGAFLAATCFTPVILETISFPVFGNEYRNPIDPNVGLLNALGLIGFILANPSYINPINSMPVYSGIIPFIVLAIYVSRIIRIVFLKCYHLIKMCVYALCAAIIIYSYIYINIYLIIFIISCILFLHLGHIFNIKYNILHIIYLSTIMWIIFWSTSGPAQNILRPVLPLLSLVRWYNLQMYLAEVFIIILSWSVVKNLTFIKYNKALTLKSNNIIQLLLILLLILYFVILNVSKFTNAIVAENDKLGAIPLVWTIACLAALIAIIPFIFLYKNKLIQLKISRFGASAGLSLSISVVVTICAYGFNSNPPKWWDTLIELPKGTNLLIDLFHMLIFMGFLICASFLKDRKAYLSVVAFLCVLDTSIASARYLGEAEIMNVGGNRAGPITVDTTVRGNERSKADSGGIVWLASTTPHIWAYPGTVPKSASVDKAWGEPSVFQKFAVFPFSWRYTDANEVYVDESDFRIIHNDYTCLSSEQIPIVEIRKFLSSEIQLSIENRCDRLLVWTDTWAKGWSVEVDGQPANIRRVNGALRGLEIQKGTIDIIWRYRPHDYLVYYVLCFMGISVSSGAIYVGSKSCTNNGKILV